MNKFRHWTLPPCILIVCAACMLIAGSVAVVCGPLRENTMVLENKFEIRRQILTKQTTRWILWNRVAKDRALLAEGLISQGGVMVSMMPTPASTFPEGGIGPMLELVLPASGKAFSLICPNESIPERIKVQRKAEITSVFVIRVQIPIRVEYLEQLLCMISPVATDIQLVIDTGSIIGGCRLSSEPI